MMKNRNSKQNELFYLLTSFPKIQTVSSFDRSGVFVLEITFEKEEFYIEKHVKFSGNERVDDLSLI